MRCGWQIHWVSLLSVSLRNLAQASDMMSYIQIGWSWFKYDLRLGISINCIIHSRARLYPCLRNRPTVKSQSSSSCFTVQVNLTPVGLKREGLRYLLEAGAWLLISCHCMTAMTQHPPHKLFSFKLEFINFALHLSFRLFVGIRMKSSKCEDWWWWGGKSAHMKSINPAESPRSTSQVWLQLSLSPAIAP